MSGCLRWPARIAELQAKARGVPEITVDSLVAELDDMPALRRFSVFNPSDLSPDLCRSSHRGR